MGLSELEDAVKRITTAIGQLNHEEKARIVTINDAIKAGEIDTAQRERDELATTRSKIAQLEAVRDNYNKQIDSERKKKPDAKPEFRESTSATDALQKIGLGGPAAEAVAATVASVSSTRVVRGFGFSVPERSYQETKFGNFEKPNNDFKIITPLESAERNGRMSLETLRNIYQALLNKNGGTTWQ